MTCILHIIERQCHRGAELFASQLSGSLAARGFHNVLCSLYKPDTNGFTIAEPVDSLIIEAREIGLLAKVGFQPSILFNLIDIVRQVKPDIVLAHGADTLRYTALASRLCPRPLTVYRNIGMASFWSSNPLKIWANRKLLGWVDAVISVSDIAREDFLEFYGLSPNKVYAIPNAVDTKKYQSLELGRERFQMRQRLGLKEEDLVLISVGSLSFEKNHSELLTLVKELQEKSPHLLLIGDGPLRRELELKADELRLKDRVHFLGLQLDIVPFLVASDIFLLPSKSEGMPGALIEAGMAGLPSVSFDVGGTGEVIETNITGIIVPPENYDEFKIAVTSLIENPQKRRQMGALARERYPEQFAIEKVAAQYEVLLLKLLAERGKRNNGQS